MKQTKRIISAVLVVFMLVSMLPMGMFAADGSVDPVVVIACSDFQNKSCTSTNHQPGADAVQGILDAMNDEGITYADGFICCGDYYYTGEDNTTNSRNGIAALDGCITDNFGADVDRVYVQGNHDSYSVSALASTGAHDSDDYGVYVIDEDDYSSYSTSLSQTQSVAAGLSAYLQDKIDAGYDKPVFVATHVPLHAGPRTLFTRGTGNDYDKTALYSKPIVDVLNEAGEELNIIYICGHNHSCDHDAYLGGSAYFFTKGDQILVADGSGTRDYTHFAYEDLNFTYMNAGYVGYYDSYSDADSTLTMTSFEITGNRVEINRYDANGLHVLKHEGYHTGYKSNSYVTDFNNNIDAFSEAVNSPFTVQGKTALVYNTMVDADTGITVQTASGTALVAEELEDEPAPEGLSNCKVYDITIPGFEEGQKATVSIPVPAGCDEDYTRVYHVNGTNLTNMQATVENGYATFITTHFSKYAIGEIDPDALEWQEGAIPGETVYRYELDTDGIDSGSTYLVVAQNTDVAFGDDPNAGRDNYTPTQIPVTVNGNVATVSADNNSTAGWTFTANGTLTGPEATSDEKVYVPYTVRNDVTSSDGYYYKVGDNYYAVSEAARTATGTPSYTSSSIKPNNLATFPGGKEGENVLLRSDYLYNVGDNYYPIYVMKKGGNKFDVNYSVTDSASDLTYVGEFKDNTNITVWQDGTAYTYSWAISYGDNQTATSTDEAVTLYKYEYNTYNTYDAWSMKPQNRNTWIKLGTNDREVFRFEDNQNNAYKNIIIPGSNAGEYQIIAFENGEKSADITYNNGWTLDKYQDASKTYQHQTPHYVRMYKFISAEEINAGDCYIAAHGIRNFRFGLDQFSSQSEVMSYLKDEIAVYMATEADYSDMEEIDYNISVVSGNISPRTDGSTATLQITCYGVTYQFTVTFAAREVVSATIDSNSGTVVVGSNARTATGSTIHVVYDDGSEDDVDVTLEMITGLFNVKKAGTYEDLTVNYKDYEFPYTLDVQVNGELDPFPKNPAEGSVTINKTATGMSFQETGVAQVELSAKGIPYSKGVDVIIMLDASSSMTRQPDGLDTYRSYIFAESFRNMLEDLQASETGIRVAIADFNGFGESGATKRDTSDCMTTDGTFNASSYGYVYTGYNSINSRQHGTTATLTADRFVDVSTIDADAFYDWYHQTAYETSGSNTSPYASGTNYDYAFWATYQLGAAITAANEAAGEDRDLIVVFMTDGAANLYNGFSGYTSQNTSYRYAHWLTGTDLGDGIGSEDSDFLSGVSKDSTHSYFFGGIGTYAQKHRWNEAIKGTPASLFDVIDKTQNTEAGDNQYITSVVGLGADVYSIGFVLREDGYLTADVAADLVKEMASDDNYFIVNSAAELDNAFSSISGDIIEAATEAHFDDEMGAAYDLQMANFTGAEGTVKGIVNLADFGIEPKIEVVTYDVWKLNDYEAGRCTIDQVGARKSTTPTVIETVTFNADGTEAYSGLLGSENIFTDGLIVAKNFVYNTTNTAQTLSFNGKNITVGAESFYWDMGTINEKDFALRYYVYLTGSMEGQRDAGTYPTNDHATLWYVNYAGQYVSQDAPKPALSWEAASVNFAAYLVNEQGQPINAKGEVTGFSDRVIVVPVNEGDKVLFNSAETVQSMQVLASELPAEYTLFDPNASYTVAVDSGHASGNWTITSEKDTHTTYVTEYDMTNPLAASNVLTEDNETYDYTHTVVWFAVKYEVKCYPDVVVVDYGIPVNISVLSNDMFYEEGKLTYIGMTDASTDKVIDVTLGETVVGTASINGNYVNFAIKDMQSLTAPVTFRYGVTFREEVYWGDVTVVPATTIYFEDYINSVTFTDGDGNAEWSTVAIGAYTQAEDRPGTMNLTTIDANNVYGYDGTYTAFTRDSLGGSSYVTVDGSVTEWPTATFTFVGTGFDVISRTDTDQGLILVKVYEGGDTTGDLLYTWAVDNYYGYSLNQDHDFEPENNGTLYQIPVVRTNNDLLAYGKYTVEIIPMYNDVFDHNSDGSYSFYLDAIRIFDPAYGNEAANGYYLQDNEAYPQYIEIRNTLLDQKSLCSTDGMFYASVFIDDYGLNGDISDYENYGPNNEVYLKKGQAIAFKILAQDASKIASVQLGFKGVVSGGSTGIAVNGKQIAIATSTDMYYDITSFVEWEGNESNSLIITNSGTDIASLTYVKVTYKEAPVKEADAPDSAPARAFMTRAAAEEAAKFVTEYYEPIIAQDGRVFYRGDVNGDGAVNAKDLIVLRKALAEDTGMELCAGADADGDGVIGASDVIKIRRILSELDKATRGIKD